MRKCKTPTLSSRGLRCNIGRRGDLTRSVILSEAKNLLSVKQKLTFLTILILMTFLITLGFTSVALGANQPLDIKISNVSSTSFVVSWTTGSSEVGSVKYGTNPSSLNQTAYDTRGESTSSTTHYVLIKELTANTKYYFDVISGGTTDDNQGNHYELTTPIYLGVIPPPPDPAYGKVYKSDGSTPADGAIVYLRIRDNDGKGSSGKSSLLSSLVDSSGFWLIQLESARLTNYSDYFSYSSNGGDIEEIEVDGGIDGRVSAEVNTANDFPVPDIILNETVVPDLNYLIETIKHLSKCKGKPIPNPVVRDSLIFDVEFIKHMKNSGESIQMQNHRLELFIRKVDFLSKAYGVIFIRKEAAEHLINIAQIITVGAPRQMVVCDCGCLICYKWVPLPPDPTPMECIEVPED